MEQQVKMSDIINSLSPLRVANPRDDHDVNERVKSALEELQNEGEKNKDLLHSGILVFEEQRYYDCTRLYLFTENVYSNIVKTITDSQVVNISIKKAIPEFSCLGFPRETNIDEPPKSIKVSIFDRDNLIEVETIISYFTGKELKFISYFQY